MAPYSLGGSLLASKDLDLKQGVTFIDLQETETVSHGCVGTEFLAEPSCLKSRIRFALHQACTTSSLHCNGCALHCFCHFRHNAGWQTGLCANEAIDFYGKLWVCAQMLFTCFTALPN